jgi:putative transposase
VVAQQTAIVALGLTGDGHKEPLGVSLGSTENAGVCTELLQELLARGLTIDGRVLCVIDGGKGLRKALGDVFGDAAVINAVNSTRRATWPRWCPRPARGTCAPRSAGRTGRRARRRPAAS